MNQSKFNSTPVTELPNETTVDIDSSDSTGIIRILRQCDSQIFSGWKSHPCIYDNETIEPLEKLTKYITQVLKDPENSRVVFSGCGTSGRIGFMLAKKFNMLAEKQGTSGVYSYIIAGGDAALISSVELPEDDWRQGQLDLVKVVQEKTKVVFVGITCGLSAAYVAGQLDYCMDFPDTVVPVLLGFNPIDLARKTSIEGTNKTFFDIAKRLSEHENGVIINPVVGPEAITGSSRMKGGSATKILLETALLKAHNEIRNPECQLNPRNLLLSYESVYRETYFQVEKLSKVMDLAGASLRKGRHVYYVAWGPPSFMAILDASECVPTFSASFDDVRAFVHGGLELPCNEEPISIGGTKVEMSVKYFIKDVLPKIFQDDVVIAICLSSTFLDEVTQLATQISAKRAKIVGLLSQKETHNIEEVFDVCVVLNNENNKLSNFLPDLKLQEFFSQCLDELAVKWILNAASTGGHVLKGKVFQSLMIDVKISNDKLFRRAIGIVSEVARVGENEAMAALLKAIYKTNQIPESITNDVISNHVTVGTQQDQVVPLAILLASGKFTVESGLRTLEEKTFSQTLKELHLI